VIEPEDGPKKSDILHSAPKAGDCC
jgi:hypothetical protein